jgi:hypothetical protein
MVGPEFAQQALDNSSRREGRGGVRGVQGVRVQGVQEFRSSGVQEFRSSGVQEFRSSGVQEFRSAVDHSIARK